MKIKSRRFLCKAIAFVFLLSNLLTAMPGMQIVFAADKPDKEEKIKYEDREKTEIIVKYKAGRAKDEIKNRVKQSLKLAKMDRKKSYARFNADLLQIGRADDMSKVITMLKSDPDVEYVQPNYKLEIQTLPADLRFNEQWGLLNTGQEIEGSTGRAGVDINAVNAWDLTKGSSAVVVGILDTGID
ncbi:MAG TPA: hypothetical protein VN580_01425, partial [Clostridia bacterium]|nr:hypothetical protein [Clostridia bacterium]